MVFMQNHAQLCVCKHAIAYNTENLLNKYVKYKFIVFLLHRREQKLN